MKRPNETEYFTYVNANPKGRTTSDSAIRAIAVATGKPYDEVFTTLISLSRMTGYMPTDARCFGAYLESLGWVAYDRPAKGKKELVTAKEFCGFTNNTVVAGLRGRHISCCKNRKWHDSWDCTDKYVLKFWMKEQPEEN